MEALDDSEDDQETKNKITRKQAVQLSRPNLNEEIFLKFSNEEVK